MHHPSFLVAHAPTTPPNANRENFQ